MITRDPANPLSFVLLEADDFVGNNYWANNFNDMMSGMNVLFNLLVVNNWTGKFVIFLPLEVNESLSLVIPFPFHLTPLICL